MGKSAGSPISHESQENRYRYVIAGLILAAHLCIGLNVFAVSPVLSVVIEEYGISRAGASLLATANHWRARRLRRGVVQRDPEVYWLAARARHYCGKRHAV